MITRSDTGKTSLAEIRFRIMMVITVVYIPLGMLVSRSLWDFFWGWVWSQALAFFFCVYLIRSLIFYLHRNETLRDWLSAPGVFSTDSTWEAKINYQRWLENGGDPFYDALPTFLNPDSDEVRRAIWKAPGK